jgi:hypothetical protein
MGVEVSDPAVEEPEQAVEPVAQQRQIDIGGQGLDASPEELRQHFFIAPVAVQVKTAGVIQDQGLKLPRRPDRLRAFQGGKPNIPLRANEGCGGFLLLPGNSRDPTGTGSLPHTAIGGAAPLRIASETNSSRSLSVHFLKEEIVSSFCPAIFPVNIPLFPNNSENFRYLLYL